MGARVTVADFLVAKITAAGLNVLVAAVNAIDSRAGDLEALGSAAGKTTPSTNTTSTTYVTVTGAPVATFTKRRTDTRIVVWVFSEMFNATTTTVGFGVQVAGADYDVKSGPFAVANTRQSFDGVIVVPAGVTAGSVTVTPRWKTTAGTLTTSLTSWTIYAEERY